MKNFFLPALLALTTAMAGAPATAAAVALTLDLAPADFHFLPHADGSVEADAFPAFSPIALASGDKLTVNVGFAGARAALSDISPLNQGIEAITLSLLPFDPSLYAAAFVTVDFIDPLGDLVPGPRIFAGQLGFSGGLSWQVARNLTDSAMSISGVRFEYEFGSGTTPFILNGGLFGFYGGNVGFAEVPEPSTIALCAVALLATSLSRPRRQRRSAA